MKNGKYENVIFYYKDGKLHREDGPAMEWESGTKYWCIEGKLHRLDGPAIERPDGSKCWYVEDKKIECSSQEEFERIINLLYFW